MPSMTPQAFVTKWKQSALKESAGAQSHFNDLCRLLNHHTPAEADPGGEWFTFEAGATKSTGGQGFADVWKKGHFAWEYKGKHKNLDKAYQQLLKYHDALQNPPLLIVSDMETIRIHTKFTNTVKRTYELTLDDLLDPEQRRVLYDAFHDPMALKAPQSTEQVTREAAADFARLADILRGYGEEPEASAHFLIRLLFCLFAEDVALLPENIFTRLINQTQGKSADFQVLLQKLFGNMSVGGYFGADNIRNFDGGLFDDDTALELDSTGLRTLQKVSRLDWSSIEPSIFGTLFERSLNPGKRAQLGAHYTSKEDILLVVEPVLMAPLRRRWEEVQAEVATYAERRDRSDYKATKTRNQNKIQETIEAFQQALADVRVLDPACGSGNFLYVALRELLDLWKQASTLALSQGLSARLPFEHNAPSPEQLYGIETNPYSHELAQVTVWIGYIQWLNENGYGLPSDPVLKQLDNIKEMDAILTYDESGQPVEPAWPEADVVIGNPPFLGGKKMRSELGDAYVDDLFAVYEGRVPHEADLVTYWFEKARALIAEGELERAGLLATQAIRGGANREILERIKETGNIFWAFSDRDWILDGATVHVSMIGFDNGQIDDYKLDGAPVERINPDLTGNVDVTVAEQLPENEELSFMGVTPAGSFYVPGELARKWLEITNNPNGRPNSDVVRPYYNGLDINRRVRDVWIVDFGVDMSLEEASLYEAPFEYVRENVYPTRKNNNRESYRKYWWLLAEARPAMREALEPLDRYIATSMVSKHQFFVWVSKDVLPANLLIVVAREDDYFFGVLHSGIHELWARNKGTQLRDASSGFRYTPTTTFATFPFPWSPGEEPGEEADPQVKAIAEAARGLVKKRQRWLHPGTLPAKALKKRTLTNLYNQNPTWLQHAHTRLDHAVLDAYGWPHNLDNEEILEHLLALNLERAEE